MRVSDVIAAMTGVLLVAVPFVVLPMMANYECHGSAFLPKPNEPQTGQNPCATHSGH